MKYYISVLEEKHLVSDFRSWYLNKFIFTPTIGESGSTRPRVKSAGVSSAGSTRPYKYIYICIVMVLSFYQVVSKERNR